MKPLGRTTRSKKMNADAYAGFLKLWITPPSKELRSSPEVEEYLRHLAQKSPLTDATRRAIGDHADRAA